MAEIVLAARELALTFPARRWGGGARAVTALADVSLQLGQGQTLGIVGATGSGKSSLVRVLACLVPPSSGEVYWAGTRVDCLSERRRRPLRRMVQVLFQDPGSSFNPRHSAGFALREAAKLGRGLREAEIPDAVAEALRVVGLPPTEDLSKRIYEYSGGQRQRLALARVLLAKPSVLLLDEPVAALDAPLRRRFASELHLLVRQSGAAAVVVTHDFGLLPGVAERVAVLLGGRIVEEGPWQAVQKSPRHPYTAALLRAAEGPKPEGPFLQLAEVGCPFRCGCTRASQLCQELPPLPGDGGHRWACHHPLLKTPEAKDS